MKGSESESSGAGVDGSRDAASLSSVSFSVFVSSSVSVSDSAGSSFSTASPFPRLVRAVCVSGSGASSFPLTISHIQSAIPPGTASTAVCGQ